MTLIDDIKICILSSRQATIYFITLIVLSFIESFSDNLKFKVVMLGLLVIVAYLFGYYLGISAQKNFGDAK